MEVPLIAVSGDLARLGILQLSYGVADGVLITLQGDALRELSVDSMGALPVDSLGIPLVVPDEGLVDLAGLAGYAGSSARWGVGGGVAVLFAR